MSALVSIGLCCKDAAFGWLRVAWRCGVSRAVCEPSKVSGLDAQGLLVDKFDRVADGGGRHKLDQRRGGSRRHL